ASDPYALSLHDALPIWPRFTRAWTSLVTSDAGARWSPRAVARFKPLLFLLCLLPLARWAGLAAGGDGLGANPPEYLIRATGLWRSEEHTSELQSRENLV